MKRPSKKILCYPHIEPDLNWLKRTLLVTDEVVRITPHDSSRDITPEFQQFCDAVPGAVSSVEPIDSDIELGASELSRLNKAFEGIASSDHKPGKNSIVFIIHEDGDIQIEGHNLLHGTKFSTSVAELLKQHNLLRPELQGFTEVTGKGGFEVVEERASNLIMSVLADKIARRKRWDSITDDSLGYAITSLNALENPLGPSVRSAVIEYLVDVAIPRNVTELDLRSYRILRNSYSDIRLLFQQVTHDILTDEQLPYISDAKLLRERLTDISSEFKDEVEGYRKSAFAKGLGRWTRMSFSQMSKVVAAVGVVADTGLIGLEGKMFATAGAVIVTVLSQGLLSQLPPETSEQRLIRRLCKLESTAAKRRIVRRLL